MERQSDEQGMTLLEIDLRAATDEARRMMDGMYDTVAAEIRRVLDEFYAHHAHEWTSEAVQRGLHALQVSVVRSFLEAVEGGPQVAETFRGVFAEYARRRPQQP